MSQPPGPTYGQRCRFEWNKSLPYNGATGHFEWLTDIMSGEAVYQVLFTLADTMIMRARSNIVQHARGKNAGRLAESFELEITVSTSRYGDRYIAHVANTAPYAAQVDKNPGPNAHFFKRAFASIGG